MEYVQLVCALIGVLALIFLFFWILRKVNKGILSVSGKRLKVLDRASLGGEKSVVVVSVAGKCMVLGVTAGRITRSRICRLRKKNICLNFILREAESRITSSPPSVTQWLKT